MDLRQLFKWTGVCSVILAVIVLVYYVIAVAANGFMVLSTAPLTADQIIQLAQASGNHVNAGLDLVTYFFWIPTLVGLFAILRERAPGRAYVGGAFAAFAVACFAIASILALVALAQAQGTVTAALKERLETLYAVYFPLTALGTVAVALWSLLWGLALRSQPGLKRIIGYLFLVWVGLAILMTVVSVAQLDLLANVGFLISSLVSAVLWLSVGALLSEASKKAEGRHTGAPATLTESEQMALPRG